MANDRWRLWPFGRRSKNESQPVTVIVHDGEFPRRMTLAEVEAEYGAEAALEAAASLPDADVVDEHLR